MRYINKINKIFILIFLLLSSISVYCQQQDNSIADYYKSPISSNVTFSFAQLTDIHISITNSQNTEDLANAVNDINKQGHIAFVIVSGDIAETGDYKSLNLAKKELDKLNCPYFIIPGNHDTKWSESGATDFIRIFGDDKFRLQFNGFVFLGFNSGPIIKMGDGHIAPQDIQWVERQLKNIGKKTPVFLVTHYPLKGGDVDNWYNLTDAVRKYNIQAFLGGHYHRNLLNNYDEIPGILCRSTLRANDSIGGYTIYDVFKDSISVNEKIIGLPQREWAKLAIEQKIYLEGNTKSNQRPDFSINNVYKNIKEEWVVNNKVGIYGSPAVDENSIYFGDDFGVMHCLSLNKGKKIWSYNTLNRIASTPIIYNDYIVFGSCDFYIYCLNKNTGKLIWKFKTNNAVLGSPIVDNNIVYIGSSDRYFRAINIETGDLIWSFNELNNYQESRPVIVDNKIIFGAWDSYLYCLDKTNGNLLWKWNNGNERPHYSPAAVWPVVANEKVFIVAPDRFFTAIDINSGKTVWRTKNHKVRESIGISKDKQLVYAKCMNDSVVAISTTSSHPDVVWKINAEYGYDHNSSMLIDDGNHLLLTTKNGLIVALNPKTGNIIWKHKFSNSIINTIIPVSDNKWAITTTEGYIAIISEK